MGPKLPSARRAGLAEERRRPRRKANRALVAAVAGLGAVSAVFACLDPFAPPPGTYGFQPPAAYRAAWDSVEACSGLRGNFGRVRWYAVPQTPFPCYEGFCAGAWERPHNIYIAEGFIHDSVSRYRTARHEMLHDLLGGGLDHPPVFVACGLLRGSFRVQASSLRRSSE